MILDHFHLFEVICFVSLLILKILIEVTVMRYLFMFTSYLFCDYQIRIRTSNANDSWALGCSVLLDSEVKTAFWSPQLPLVSGEETWVVPVVATNFHGVRGNVEICPLPLAGFLPRGEGRIQSELELTLSPYMLASMVLFCVSICIFFRLYIYPCSILSKRIISC